MNRYSDKKRKKIKKKQKNALFFLIGVDNFEQMF
tara:strand:- start:1353 stop:1454 length:102 start_codon:yes stop_codon:yes gene_type:complete